MMQHGYVDQGEAQRIFRSSSGAGGSGGGGGGGGGISKHSSSTSSPSLSATFALGSNGAYVSGGGSSTSMAPLLLGRAPESPHGRGGQQAGSHPYFPHEQANSTTNSPGYGNSSAMYASSPSGSRHSPFNNAGSSMIPPVMKSHRGSLSAQSGSHGSGSGSPADSQAYGSGFAPLSGQQSGHSFQGQSQLNSFSNNQSIGNSGGWHPQQAYHQSDARAPSSSPASDAGQLRHVGVAPLRRGQACQSCRKRKLKCDAVRPVCSTCVKSRKAAAQANHVSPVPEGDCVYDDGPVSVGQEHAVAISASTSSSAPSDEKQKALKRPRTSTSGPSGMASTSFDSRPMSKAHKVEVSALTGKETPEQRVVRLEGRIAELEEKLRQARWHQGHNWEIGTTPHRFRSRANSREPENVEETFRPAVPILSMLSPLSGREERHRMLYSQRPARFGQTVPSSSPLVPKGTMGYPNGVEQHQQHPQAVDPMLHSTTVKEEAHVAPIDVSTSPVTDETFMRLLWPGWSSDLPSAETVTSLCEIFFRLHPMRSLVYKPSFMSGLLLPPRHPHRPHDSLIHSILCAAADISPFYEPSSMVSGVRDRFALFLSDPFSRPNLQQPQSVDMLTFKEFHLSKARQKVERSLMTDFKNPLDWIASCLISCFILWNDSRFVEAYFLCGFCTRALAPAGLDKLPSKHLSSKSGKLHQAPGIFGDPQGIEEHERRIVFWHTFIADQYTSGPPSFYENMINEQATLTHLPCRMSDFMAGNDVAPNSQMLNAPDLFTNGHLDDFTLHIKSCVLLRRAGTLSCRTQMMRSKPPGVSVVDRHIDEFIGSFPTMPVHQSSCDSLNAYTNISLALFYLHEPYLTKTALCTVSEAEPSPTSDNGRVLLGVEKMMQVLHELMNTSLDFALLHPQMFLTWSVCARMMGKDMMLLQHRLQQKPSGEKQAAVSEALKSASVAPDETAALKRVMDNLDTIVAALRRGGGKSLKAKRCAELVSSVRSGHLHESYLSHLLYLDGVIPVEEELNNAAGNGPMANFDAALAVFPQESPFDMLVMPSSELSSADQQPRSTGSTAEFASGIIDATAFSNTNGSGGNSGVGAGTEATGSMSYSHV